MLDSTVIGVDFLLHSCESGLELSVVKLSDSDQLLKSGNFLIIFMRNVDCISVLLVKSFDLLAFLVDLSIYNAIFLSQLVDLLVTLVQISVCV